MSAVTLPTDAIVTSWVRVDDPTLDAVTAPTLRRRLVEAALGVQRVVVDLSGVEHMDAAGLSAIVSTRRQLRSVGVTVELTGARHPEVRHVLAVTRFALLFDLGADTADVA